MSNKLTKPGMKLTAVSASLGLLLAINNAQAVEVNITKMEFYDALGAPSFFGGGLNTSVATTVNFSIANTGAANSGPSPFFGTPWTATQAMWDEATGAPATWSGTSSSGAYSYTYTLQANEVAVGLLFTWGSAIDIAVLQIFNCKDNITCTPVTHDPAHASPPVSHNVPGTFMANGPFTNQHATFSGVIPANFDVTLSATQDGKNLVMATTGGGNPIITPSITGASGVTTYLWSSNPAALAAAQTGGGLANSTLVFSPAGLASGTTYTVTLTTAIDGNSVSQTIPITAYTSSLTAVDTDGDGLNDNDGSEGYVDNDGDGIPNYLDPTNDNAALVAVSSTDASKGDMSASNGTLRLGATAQSKSITSMTGGGIGASGMALTISEIGDGTGDSAVSSNCAGGCFDFEISGLANGASTQVIIPLSEGLPTFPVYRKYSPLTSSWRGFLYDDDNFISSAAALSTNPVTCPAAGSSSYTFGLSPGNSCLQLTMTDGGPNDADGFANGVLADPGGISTSGEAVQFANVPSGCSMSTIPVNPTERADWWLVAGFLGALAWLRGMRRKNSTS